VLCCQHSLRRGVYHRLAQMVPVWQSRRGPSNAIRPSDHHQSNMAILEGVVADCCELGSSHHHQSNMAILEGVTYCRKLGLSDHHQSNTAILEGVTDCNKLGSSDHRQSNMTILEGVADHCNPSLDQERVWQIYKKRVRLP